VKVLNIVEAAYRGTLEEQDDTIVWICHAMKGANADIDVLLRGNAVNYAVTAQDASGLSFGGAQQTQPPQLANDLVKLKGKGAKIFVIEDAVRERGIEPNELIDGVDFVSRAGLAKLFGDYEQVWHW
jgi:intracellular sulfur oxidation DsrE/DsrF family protein